MHNTLYAKTSKQVTIFSTGHIAMQYLHLRTATVTTQTLAHGLDVTSATQHQHAIDSALSEMLSCQQSKSTSASRHNPVRT